MPPELVQHPKYRILRELGRGGMGVVYQARQTGIMDRQVVIKVISRSLLDQPAALERFLREVHAAAQLSHPNIVTAFDAEKAGDLHMLVMEFVPGQNLAEVLTKKGPLPVTSACQYARQVAWALQHAHERGMVHRDIKPQNLMLTPKGQVKVLDFGLAKVVSERTTGKAITASDAYMGTPEYSAPEQATDARSADIRADLYSLGCTLYCLLAGRPPFREDTAMKTILAHLQQAPQPLMELRPEVPERLWRVIARLLAKEPGQRYQKPIELVQALAPFVKSGAKPEAKNEPAPVVVSPEKGTLIAADTRQIKKVLREVPGKTPPKQVPVKAKEASESTNQVPARRAGRWPLLAGAGVLLLVLLGVWASGVFKVKTPDGILIVEVNEPDPEVFIDGEKVTVSWDNGGKKAEIRVKLGTRKVEVKKDGFTVFGEEVEVQADKQRVLIARLVKEPPPAPLDSNPPVPEPNVQETILIVEVNEANSDVYVDGEKQNIAWKNDGKRAEIALKPGMRKVEVKKDGFTAWGEEVELQDGRRRILTARLARRTTTDKGGAPPSPAGGTADRVEDVYAIKVKKNGRGDVTAKDTQEIRDIHVKVEGPDGKVREDKKEVKTTTEVYRETILEKEAGKKATKLRREYSKAVVKTGEAVKTLPYEGKSVLIEKKDSKFHFTIEGGEELAGEDAELLNGLFNKDSKEDSDDDPAKGYFPKKPLKVNESWAIDASAPLIKSLEKAPNGALPVDRAKVAGTGKLLRAYKKDGKQYGVFAIRIDIPLQGDWPLGSGQSATVETGSTMTLHIDVDACIDGTSSDAITESSMEMNINSKVKEGDLKGYKMTFVTKQKIKATIAGDAEVARPQPAPSPTGPLKLAWDKPIDPAGDCTFKNNAGKLTIAIPGSLHVLEIFSNYSKAPRVLFDVEGDFTVQVRVGGDFAPVKKSSSAGNLPWIGAGLLLGVDAGTYLRFERVAKDFGGGWTPHTQWLVRQDSTGKHERVFLPSVDAEETYLRLERRGSTILAAFSPDGKQWNDVKPLEITLPAKVKIGLVAGSMSAKPFAATFDQLQFKKGKGEMLPVNLPISAAKEPVAVKPPSPPQPPTPNPSTPNPPTAQPETGKPVYKGGVVVGRIGRVDQAKKLLHIELTIGKKIEWADWQCTDDVKVRMQNPPPAFDDKGKPKKYTPNELRELKGNDKNLQGYPAEFSDLKPGQYVVVKLVRKQGGPRRPKDAATGPTGEYAPHISVIVVRDDPKKK